MKPRKVWATRWKSTRTDEIDFWGRRPMPDRDGDFPSFEQSAPVNNSYLGGLCPRIIQRITGFDLKPGECKRVVIKVEEA